MRHTLLVLAVAAAGDPNGMTDPATFASDRAAFRRAITVAEGLGPVYNASSCAACHNNPVPGGGGTATVLRTGHTDGKKYLPQTESGILHDRALDPSIQERPSPLWEVRALRVSPTLLGLGYVECIPSSEILANRTNGGRATIVDLLEAGDVVRVGRFGWKAQHASLLSFAADAYRNEMGGTSPLYRVRNWEPCDTRTFGRPADPVDAGGIQGGGKNVEAFARFMRSTLPPDRDSRLDADAVAGRLLFHQVGCTTCHREEYTTLPAGTRINGGTFVVPPALGCKTIRPYSDFLLHDVGTGDGVTQGGPDYTALMFRTPPLWGLRHKSRLMHDGVPSTPHEAILRHGGEATVIVRLYQRLSSARQEQLVLFLKSL